MNFWGWVCDVFALTPAQELEYHQSLLDNGLIDPTPQETAVMEQEEISNYLEWMPIHSDVWYDGEFTGFKQYYQIDQQGRRHNVGEVESFYAGHTGEPPDPELLEVLAEVVEEGRIAGYLK